MVSDYIGRLPLLLREQLVDGRWLPIIGAGLSANSKTTAGHRPPLWNELGRRVEAYLPAGYSNGSPVDAISAFEQQHGRAALADLMRQLLFTDALKPSKTHLAFARIPFDAVVTTNVDFLLESAWMESVWPYETIIGEQLLASHRRPDATQLVKFHGDLRHPDNLVLTEGDYDRFLANSPMLATYVANLLITRVPVLIGYSADDPDFRALLSFVQDRLGDNRTTPWALLARGTASDVARFERRGVQALILSRNPKADHGQVLGRLFDQLALELVRSAAQQAQGTDDTLLAQLRLGVDAAKSLVLFVGSNQRLAAFRSTAFPLLRRHGLIPVTVDDIPVAPRLRLATRNHLLERSACVVLDGASHDESGIASLLQSNSVPLVLVDPSGVQRRTHPDARTVEVVDPWDPASVVDLVEDIADMAFDEGQTRVEVAFLAVEAVPEDDDSDHHAMTFLRAFVEVEGLLRRHEDQDVRLPLRRVIEDSRFLTIESRETIREAAIVRNNLVHNGIAPTQEALMTLTRRLGAVTAELRHDE